MTTVPMSARARSTWKRPETRGVLAIWAVLTALLVAFSFVPARLMGPPASPTKRAVEDTMTVFTIAASPVAALVWAIAIYSLFKWRRRDAGGPDEHDGPAIRNNRPATVVWMFLSSLLCVFLLIWGLAEIESVNASATAEDPLIVNVTGQQWVWTFSYPRNGNVESDELYLPIDRPVVFHVKSDDVIHSFWIVQLGIKVDANPGMTTQTTVRPTKMGVFDVRCAELCGLLHADMETHAHVVSSTRFSHWISARGGHSSAG